MGLPAPPIKLLKKKKHPRHSSVTLTAAFNYDTTCFYKHQLNLEQVPKMKYGCLFSKSRANFKDHAFALVYIIQHGNQLLYSLSKPQMGDGRAESSDSGWHTCTDLAE